MLGQLLSTHGISNIILERCSADAVLGRIQAGVIEKSTADLIDESGVGARMHRDGLIHQGIEIEFTGRRHRIDFAELIGKTVIGYGQAELTKDLMDARAAAGGQIFYEISDVILHDIDGVSPTVRYRNCGMAQQIECDFIAGCDGFRGVSRKSIPQTVLHEYERLYPFSWLGMLVDQTPICPEPMYVHHERGFALCSVVSPTRSRFYIQCRPDERVADWSDERFYEELGRRFDKSTRALLKAAKSIETSIVPLHGFVAEPMRYGSRFLAGDAAHVVPPTGAKGLNMAAADVHDLWQSLLTFYKGGSSAGIDAYSARALQRVWKAERFSWWITSLLHQFPEASGFDRRIQQFELESLLSSGAAKTTLAQNYVGFPD